MIRGDGCGPELVDAMLGVLKAANTGVELIPCEAGFEWWESHGGSSFIPPDTWDVLQSSDACLKGPTTTAIGPGTPRSVAVSIRQRFDLYANIRPIKTFVGTEGPLGPVDFVCVREATEGLYSGLEHRLSNDVAIAIRKITRRSSENVARKAFEIARERGWKNIIVVNKANILKETDGLFLEAVRGVAQGFPEINPEEYLVDNFAQQLVKNPQRFNQNVILSTNLFMDVLSEEASALLGSIGCVYSSNFGDHYAMFEPAHGSSPKYKGLDKVNPVAMILSGAWMLEYVGEKTQAQAVFDATEQVIAEGKMLTYDMGGNASMSQMASAISQKVNLILHH